LGGVVSFGGKLIMRNLITKILLIACLSAYCCSSSNNEWSEWSKHKDYYIAFPFDDFFKDYYLFKFVDYDKHSFYVLSKKTKPENKIPPFKNFEIIKGNNYYKIVFNKIDSIVSIKSRGKIDILVLDSRNEVSETIWSYDTLRVPAFTSKNIFGMYIEILE
jgi:hypothetical protein